MKKSLWFVALALLVVPALALAADAGGVKGALVKTLGQGFLLVLPVIIPLAVAGLKRLMGRIPSPLVPIIAVVLGPVLDASASFLTGAESWGWYGPLLGFVGIGIRELKDQYLPAKKPA